MIHCPPTGQPRYHRCRCGRPGRRRLGWRWPQRRGVQDCDGGQPSRPGVQFRAVGHGERQMVQADALLVEDVLAAASMLGQPQPGHRPGWRRNTLRRVPSDESHSPTRWNLLRRPVPSASSCASNNRINRTARPPLPIHPRSFQGRTRRRAAKHGNLNPTVHPNNRAGPQYLSIDHSHTDLSWFARTPAHIRTQPKSTRVPEVNFTWCRNDTNTLTESIQRHRSMQAHAKRTTPDPTGCTRNFRTSA